MTRCCCQCRAVSGLLPKVTWPRPTEWGAHSGDVCSRSSSISSSIGVGELKQTTVLLSNSSRREGKDVFFPLWVLASDTFCRPGHTSLRDRSLSYQFVQTEKPEGKEGTHPAPKSSTLHKSATKATSLSVREKVRSLNEKWQWDSQTGMTKTSYFSVARTFMVIAKRNLLPYKTDRASSSCKCYTIALTHFNSI